MPKWYFILRMVPKGLFSLFAAAVGIWVVFADPVQPFEGAAQTPEQTEAWQDFQGYLVVVGLLMLVSAVLIMLLAILDARRPPLLLRSKDPEVLAIGRRIGAEVARIVKGRRHYGTAVFSDGTALDWHYPSWWSRLVGMISVARWGDSYCRVHVGRKYGRWNEGDTSYVHHESFVIDLYTGDPFRIYKVDEYQFELAGVPLITSRYRPQTREEIEFNRQLGISDPSAEDLQIMLDLLKEVNVAPPQAS